jgi:hypothetical protein
VEGCTDVENTLDSEGRWTNSVDGLPLNNSSVYYYTYYSSVLAALEQCPDALPVLDQLAASFSGDAVVMGIVNENYTICGRSAASEGQ